MVRNVEAELGQGAGLRIGAPCDVARIPEERSTPVAAEEIDPEALIETATSTHSVQSTLSHLRGLTLDARK